LPAEVIELFSSAPGEGIKDELTCPIKEFFFCDFLAELWADDTYAVAELPPYPINIY
jgi:hypothetical protein